MRDQDEEECVFDPITLLRRYIDREQPSPYERRQAKAALVVLQSERQSLDAIRAAARGAR